jgi:hypothetical protein
MKLALRLNHFFRSFWAIEDVDKRLTLKNVKYMDMAVVTAGEVCRLTRKPRVFVTGGAKSFTIKKIDTSYWDTYDMTDPWVLTMDPDLYLKKRSTTAKLCGTNNNRVENFDSWTFNNHSNDERSNLKNNWKTADIPRLRLLNEHLNMYRSIIQGP